MHHGVRFLSVSSLVLLAACIGAQSRVFVKEQITWSDYRLELDNCYAQARGKAPVDEINKNNGSAPDEPTTYVSPSTPLIGLVAIGIAGGIAHGIAKARAETEWAETCMENKGFLTVELDDSQRTRLGNLKEEHERNAFLQAVAKQQDPKTLRERAETSRIARLDTTDPRRVADINLWSSVKDSDNTVALQGYLAVFPDGKYIEEAKVRIEELENFATASTQIHADGVGLSESEKGSPVPQQISSDLVATFNRNKESLAPQIVNALERSQGSGTFDKTVSDCWIELDQADVVGKRSDGFVLEISYSKPVTHHGFQCTRGDDRSALLFSWDQENLIQIRALSQGKEAKVTEQVVLRPEPRDFSHIVRDDKTRIQSEVQNLLAKAGQYPGNCNLSISDFERIGRVEDGVAYTVTYIRQTESISVTACSAIPETKPIVFAWNGTTAEAIRLDQ